MKKIIINRLGRFASNYRKVRHFRKKIKEIDSRLDRLGVPKLDRGSIRRIDEFWSGYGLKTIPHWHRMMTWGWGRFELGFVPEDIYYPYLEKSGNYDFLTKAYVDKNNYDRIFGKRAIPETIVHNENGHYSDEDHEDMTFEQAVRRISQEEGEIVIKPSLASGGGRRIFIGKVMGKEFVTDKQRVNIASFLKDHGPDFIVQRFIDQHHRIACFHPGSVNTIRVMTARTNNSIEHLSMILRVGLGFSRNDNMTTGGLAIGIDISGKMRKRSFDDFFRRYDRHPDTNITFNGYPIPCYDKVLEFTSHLHRKLRYFQFASWDVAFDKKRGPIMVEVNLYGQEIITHQILNGPLFGSDPSRILDECLRK
ncbi:MAG: sugar-transfer associated ATP-grasp domain-containing protein [Candidatus Thermoplasmatota archaeon]|nr:sugar-transfer associated ATP-grasp domain-containing protein [Candidatus Thermoplasmatota archaeon]